MTKEYPDGIPHLIQGFLNYRNDLFVVKLFSGEELNITAELVLESIISRGIDIGIARAIINNQSRDAESDLILELEKIVMEVHYGRK